MFPNSSCASAMLWLGGSSNVRKSCRLGASKITRQDYFKQHNSSGDIKPKPTDRAIRYAICQLKKGRSTRVISEEPGATQRHVRRLWAEYSKTGAAHVQRRAGRPAGQVPSVQEIPVVPNVHGHKPESTDSQEATKGRMRYKILSRICDSEGQ